MVLVQTDVGSSGKKNDLESCSKTEKNNYNSSFALDFCWLYLLGLGNCILLYRMCKLVNNEWPCDQMVSVQAVFESSFNWIRSPGQESAIVI